MGKYLSEIITFPYIPAANTKSFAKLSNLVYFDKESSPWKKKKKKKEKMNDYSSFSDHNKTLKVL